MTVMIGALPTLPRIREIPLIAELGDFTLHLEVIGQSLSKSKIGRNKSLNSGLSSAQISFRIPRIMKVPMCKKKFRYIFGYDAFYIATYFGWAL